MRHYLRHLGHRFAIAARFASAFLAVCSSGCGHPASRQECELIFGRSAEIALKSQNITDPAEVERQVAEAREAKGKAMLEDCVGKRITDEALQCVRRAETPEQLDKCLQ